MKTLKKIALGFFISAMLASCATTNVETAPKLNPVYVTNSTKVELLPPSAVKTEIDEYDLFEGTFGDTEIATPVYLSADSAGISVVLLSDMGVTLGELKYDGKSCTVDSSMIPKKLKPEYIILDLQNAYADFGELKRHYKEKDLSFTEEIECPDEGGEEKTVRILSKSGKEIERIEITGKKITINNSLRKYEYKITKPEE